MEQMKKVMGAEANMDVAKDSCGKIMKLGGYKLKDIPEVAKNLSGANKSGYSGASDCKQKYQ